MQSLSMSSILFRHIDWVLWWWHNRWRIPKTSRIKLSIMVVKVKITLFCFSRVSSVLDIFPVCEPIAFELLWGTSCVIATCTLRCSCPCLWLAGGARCCQARPCPSCSHWLTERNILRCSDKTQPWARAWQAAETRAQSSTCLKWSEIRVMILTRSSTVISTPKYHSPTPLSKEKLSRIFIKISRSVNR